MVLTTSLLNKMPAIIKFFLLAAKDNRGECLHLLYTHVYKIL